MWESEPNAVVGLLKVVADLSRRIVFGKEPRRRVPMLVLVLGVGGGASPCWRGSRELRKDA